MSKEKEVLIVGAGPSGLSTAIFLSEMGYKPRIIDKKESISDYSKALGVNPRTLEIFEPLGITKRFLSNGRKMKAINLWYGHEHVYKNDFEKANHAYPFMLIQTQKDSEEILLDEVEKRGITVEYGTELTSIDSRKATIKHHGSEHEIAHDILIGADGGKSKVRELSGMKYDGFRYDQVWELYDVELEIDIDQDEGHVLLFEDGGMLMIRLKDNLWRVAGSLKSLLNHLPKNTKIGAITWESTFRIHHKLANKLNADGIGLIGDAAHLHSPIGARGMNLGIEDAYILSKLIYKNELHTYDQLRRPYLEKTVKSINNITMTVAGNSGRSRFIRRNLNRLKFVFPLVMPNARKFVLGINQQ